MIRKAESASSCGEVAKENAEVVSPPKVEVATDLFDMLSMHDCSGDNGSVATPTDDMWAGFQCMSFVTLPLFKSVILINGIKTRISGP